MNRVDVRNDKYEPVALQRERAAGGGGWTFYYVAGDPVTPKAYREFIRQRDRIKELEDQVDDLKRRYEPPDDDFDVDDFYRD